MGAFDTILMNLPEVSGPTQKRLSFKEKLKWTLIILIIFYLLGLIPLYGLGQNALEQFTFLSMILGAEFGSLISLGIGPIVTASIVLQLLNGSGILKFDTTTTEGKKRFQGVQKLLSVAFVLFEGFIYVYMGGLAPAAEFVGTPIFTQLRLILVFQLFLGGLMIMLMDEIISKWGFGSGISLFIAAGVSKSVFIRAFSWVKTDTGAFVGAVPQMFRSFAENLPLDAGIQLASILATIAVFAMAVYGQAMKIEIPLSFGRIRGHGIRWPLQFIYTSNIPVILVAALLANLQLWARLMQNWAESAGGVVSWISANIVGQYAGQTPDSGLLLLVSPPNVVLEIINGTFNSGILVRTIGYIIIMMIGAVIFSWFWVQTSGMDAKSQAKQIMASGLQIPGFRKDQRVLERLLDRYIKPLTVMGAMAVGILAAAADVTGALANGTGLLLTVMILYRLYEEIAKQHMMDLSPGMRKYMAF